MFAALRRASVEAGVAWRGAAHITGGGLVENPPRFVPEASGLALRLRPGSWPVPPVFTLIQSAGVDETEMRRTFNMGLGMVIAVPSPDATRAVEALIAAGEQAFVVGEVITRTSAEVEFA